MPYLIILGVGFLFLLLGLWSSRMLIKSAHEFADDAETESGRHVRDRTTGLGLYNAWVSLIIGVGLILLALFFWVERIFD